MQPLSPLNLNNKVETGFLFIYSKLIIVMVIKITEDEEDLIRFPDIKSFTHHE